MKSGEHAIWEAHLAKVQILRLCHLRAVDRIYTLGNVEGWVE